MTQEFHPREGVSIAYNRTPPLNKDLPGVMFMGGFRSDMTGAKATYLETLCKNRGQAYVRFDYTAHGRSSGEFREATISGWLQDSLDVFDALTEGPQVVVGSSMGGWLALLLVLRRQDRVQGLVLIAPAPDFTRDLLSILTPAERRGLETDGVVYRDNAYGPPHPFTRRLLDDGANHLLLDKEIPLACPVRLIHGKKDADVPWQKSAMIRDKLTSKDVTVDWVEDGDHRLSRDADLALIGQRVGELSQ
jgi:pimeloyl-ACP methyl ester carboxylesterase